MATYLHEDWENTSGEWVLGWLAIGIGGTILLSSSSPVWGALAILLGIFGVLEIASSLLLR